MKLKIIIVFLFIFANSCETQKNNTNELKYYISIQSSYLFSKKTIDRCYETVQKIALKLQDESYSDVDARNFRLTLDSAIFSNQEELNLLKKIVEVDTTINYKSKLIDYKKGLDSFYTISCKYWISILQSDSIHKITLTKAILIKPLEHIVNLAQICEKAEKDFQIKYNIPDPYFIPAGPGNKIN